MYKFFRAQGTSSKGDEDPTTLLPKDTNLKGFKVWTKQRSK